MRRASRLVFFLVVFLSTLAFSTFGFATEAQVTRNVNLRSDPSSNSSRIKLLTPPDRIDLVEDTATNGYYHVLTEDGKEGWVWGKNIQLQATVEATLVAGVTAISEQWQKPEPNKTTFKGVEGNCPWNGDGTDPDTYARKNRSDVPSTYHDVPWSAISQLAFPDAKPLRKNWTADQLAKLAKYEGVALRTVGYIVAIKPEQSGEGTNCDFKKSGDYDTHIALVGKAGDSESSSVVIEWTPRVLKQHPKWTKARLEPWLDSDNPVRISGWLLLDPDHRNHLHKFRSTLWEIHPITSIEVFKNGQFVDLDSLP